MSAREKPGAPPHFDMFSKQVTEAFFRSVEAGRLAHAYLVVGRPEREGRAFALRVLSYLFCSGTNKPCGKCAGCLQVEQRRHPDLFWIEPESKSRVIRIEQIRQLNHQMSQSSYAGGWKAGVLAGADRLNTEAANAFLKTLEEPPRRSLLLLLSDAPQALLPTISSRCQRISLAGEAAEPERPWQASVVEILKAGSPGDPLERIRLAGGLEELLEAERARIGETLTDGQASGQGEAEKEVLEARVEARVRAARAAILRFMVEWHRDVLMTVLGAEENLLLNSGHVGDIREQAAGLSYMEAMARLSAVEGMMRRLERNLPAQAVFEDGL